MFFSILVFGRRFEVVASKERVEPQLYRECEKCGGSGTFNESEKRGSSMTFSHGPCPDCESIGAIPTDEGARVLDLIRRWRQSGRL
ncbi:hypothetical protein [Pseudoblastomonas halimionae]|uniref:Uncharacterized protein n=1 Tax=Alteriqipengyuania halimionae TaxID=1926630 RepID=A0A6I4U556_9SPHN|nr:hypothetical protein [Alteriqipengyuania halimionae]